MTIRLADCCAMFLSEAAVADEQIWVLDGDLADSDGALHFAKRHPDRFLMAGIAEQSMVTVAAGMASCGLKPWVFSFAAFICYRAYDQIRIGLSQARQPVKLVGSHSGGCSGRNGKSHSAVNDVAVMTSLPGIEVWSPAGPAETRFATATMLASEAPGYLRLPRTPFPDLPGPPRPCRWLGEPFPVALVTTGLGAHLALEVRSILASRGLRVGLLHCARLAPLPDEVITAFERIDLAFVIEDHYAVGGLATLLRASVPRASITPLGWDRDWVARPGTDDEVLRSGGLAPEHLAEKVLSSLGSRVGRGE